MFWMDCSALFIRILNGNCVNNFSRDEGGWLEAWKCRESNEELWPITSFALLHLDNFMGSVFRETDNNTISYIVWPAQLTQQCEICAAQWKETLRFHLIDLKYNILFKLNHQRLLGHSYRFWHSFTCRLKFSHRRYHSLPSTTQTRIKTIRIHSVQLRFLNCNRCRRYIYETFRSWKSLLISLAHNGHLAQLVLSMQCETSDGWQFVPKGSHLTRRKDWHFSLRSFSF